MIYSSTDFLYILLFSTWLLMSVFWQFNRLRDRFPFATTIWKFRALPIYTFFAPNPGIYDYRIIIRTQESVGEFSEWSEVDHLVERKWFHFLWNPKKRIEKLIADSVSSVKATILSRESYENEMEWRASLLISQGYIILLNFAAAHAPQGTTHLQFMIAETSNETANREIFPVFKSPIHQTS